MPLIGTLAVYMKQIKNTLLLAAITIGISSCYKNYSCGCTALADSTGTRQVVYEQDYRALKTEYAQSECNNIEITKRASYDSLVCALK